jgi:predicted YcjX-like family ATPase
MKEKIYSMLLKSFSSKYFISVIGKTACITLLVVNSSDGNAQKVFSVKYESQADLKVYVVKYESQADLKVFKVKYESQAADNNGKWFFTKYENQADKKIFFVDYESQAELKIFFVPYESQAGWREKSKKALLY